MATDDNLPHELVIRFIATAPGPTGIPCVVLLQMLTDSLGNVIGEEGFESLLLRSIRRAGTQYRWLQIERRNRPRDPEFEQLRQAFGGRAPEEVDAASTLLLITLIDTLAILVGAHLTTRILTSAIASARAGLREQGTAR